MLNIKDVIIICGGESLEHEISLRSAKRFFNTLKNMYNTSIIKIDKKGNWIHFTDETAFAENSPIDLIKQQIKLIPGCVNPICKGDSNTPIKCDIVFPILHGNLGEDGTIQSLCELLNLPYIGCNSLASGISMHKARCNKYLKQAGIPCLPNISIRKDEKFNPEEIANTLGLPIIIKPVHLGSSIGITIVSTTAELKNAIDKSFHFDNEIMLEPLLENARDIECSIISDGTTVFCADPGEIIKNSCVIYDYDAKYNNPHAATPVVVADLDEKTKEKFKTLAITAFKEIGGSGLARIDFLYKDNEIYLNEINPLPGYTNISLHPQCLIKAGYTMESIIESLIKSSIKQHDELPHNLQNNT
jgi:D-alanine-D-alanine ligase